MNRAHAIFATAALALAAAGCDAARPIAGAGSGASACTSCHGDGSRAEEVALVQAAPPLTTGGGADAGAHMAHLHPGALAPAVACGACHEVPTISTHADGTTAVTFPSLPRDGGLVPTWDPDTGTCSGIACHGAALQGGPAATPAWTSTAGLDCSSCHGDPPTSHAGRSPDCSTCHAGTVKADGTIWVENGLHVNGHVDATGTHAADWGLRAQHGYSVNRTGLAGCKGCHGPSLTGGSGPSCASCHAAAGFPSWDTSCTFCHGDRGTGQASPPVDTQGRSAAANVAVGSHAAHVGTTIATPIACGACHPARSASVVTDAAHVDGDGVAEVVFGSLARTGGANASYARASGTSATCSSVYCHGQFTGGTGWDPPWTSGTATCTSCHGSPGTSGDHGTHRGYGCNECHGHSGSGATHVNGAKDVPMPGISGASYNPSTRSCGSFSCHGESHPSSRTW